MIVKGFIVTIEVVLYVSYLQDLSIFALKFLVFFSYLNGGDCVVTGTA